MIVNRCQNVLTKTIKKISLTLVGGSIHASHHRSWVWFWDRTHLSCGKYWHEAFISEGKIPYKLFSLWSQPVQNMHSYSDSKQWRKTLSATGFELASLHSRMANGDSDSNFSGLLFFSWTFSFSLLFKSTCTIILLWNLCIILEPVVEWMCLLCHECTLKSEQRVLKFT